MLLVNLLLDRVDLQPHRDIDVVDPTLQRLVVVAHDLALDDLTQRARVQGFQRVELDRPLAVPLLKLGLAPFRLLDRHARQVELGNLLACQHDGPQPQVCVQPFVRDQPFRLSRDRARHRLAAGVEVADVQHTRLFADVGDATDQMVHRRDRHLTQPGNKVDLVLLAERDQDVVHRALFNPDLDVIPPRAAIAATETDARNPQPRLARQRNLGDGPAADRWPDPSSEAATKCRREDVRIRGCGDQRKRQAAPSQGIERASMPASGSSKTLQC